MPNPTACFVRVSTRVVSSVVKLAQLFAYRQSLLSSPRAVSGNEAVHAYGWMMYQRIFQRYQSVRPRQ